MIRRVKQSDINKIQQFNRNEIDVAMELVNISVNNQTQTDYNVFVYEFEGKVLGYHCTGKRPLTDAVYDLYWIIADPESEKKGIGTELVKHAEQFVMEQRARWLLAETSSRESYSRTRNFYLRNNFSIVAEINDFYSVGDNLIVFGKYFK